MTNIRYGYSVLVVSNQRFKDMSRLFWYFFVQGDPKLIDLQVSLAHRIFLNNRFFQPWHVFKSQSLKKVTLQVRRAREKLELVVKDGILWGGRRQHENFCHQEYKYDRSFCIVETYELLCLIKVIFSGQEILQTRIGWRGWEEIERRWWRGGGGGELGWWRLGGRW